MYIGSNNAKFLSYGDEHLLLHIGVIRDLTAIHASWGHCSWTTIKSDLLLFSITVKPLLCLSDGDPGSTGVVKFTNSVGDGTTALHFVCFAEESLITFSNIDDVDKAIVNVYLAIKFKVHTYYDKIERKYVITIADQKVYL